MTRGLRAYHPAAMRVSGEAFLERAYRRLGPRYPVRGLFVLLLVNLLVIGIAIAFLSFYVGMSLSDFVVLVLVGWAFEIVHDLLSLPLIRRLTRPIVAWLEGERSAEATAASWRAAASLPWDFMRQEVLSLRLGVYVPLVILAWCFFFAWQTGVSAGSALLLYVVAAVYLAYAFALRFFAVERVIRPVLEDIASQLGDDAPPAVSGFSVQTRLLLALPAINVITAVVAYGVARGGDADLGDLAIVTLIAAAVAATISLALTLLLSDSITEPIAELRAATGRVGAGEFEARVPVITTDETGELARSFNQMTAGLQQREQLREAFGTFVDPDLTERVLEEGTDLAGDEVEVSLLFMDIRGFTTYSEQAQPQEVVARLNDLYGEVVPAILRDGGHANKFIGDGLLAVFGAPNRLLDHADRAVAAGLDIARLVRERYQGELRVGIGINSGRVVVGTIGGGGRLDFTVIGDAVNTAARVESATRQTDDDLLITESTLGLLSGRFGGWDERPRVTLKGKAQEVRLYSPRSLETAPQPTT
jgi:adenylate cyclase